MFGTDHLALVRLAQAHTVRVSGAQLKKAERVAHLISLSQVNLFTRGKLCILPPRKKL